MKPKLRVLGAAGCVTGSCMLLETATARVLIDCGMFQGPKTLKALNYEPFPFDAKDIDAVLLTHAHIDHSGLLPKLALAGFKGPIFATAGSEELCRVMLPDAGAIQEMEVEALNIRRQRHGEAELQPIFTRGDAEKVMSQFRRVVLKDWIEAAKGVRARWWNAGHILGAASIEVEVESDSGSERILFSGDIGPSGREFADDPEGPAGVDHLVLESTYGDVERPPLTTAERRAELVRQMLEAHAAGGPLLIPAFAVERTQELIIDLLEVMESGAAPRGPIFLDSPLAIRASDVFLRYGEGRDGARPFAALKETAWLRYTETADESRAIERFHGWCVIVAASGMCDAGRVRHHLKRLLWRPDATILLSGYQAIGTLGRLLQEGRGLVRIQGSEIKVAARIRNLEIYSGHADGPGLVRWAQARGPVRGSIILTHGEPKNLDGLKRRLSAAAIGAPVIAATLDSEFELDAGHEAQVRATIARLSPQRAAGLDWHNARSQVLTDLNRLLAQAPDDAAREALLKRVGAALTPSALARDQDAPAQS